jgi:hypothetical protein
MIVNILWAGGWDQYDVDVDVMVSDAQPSGLRTEPTLYGEGKYLRTLFSSALKKYPNMAVKINRHIDGGN